MRERKTTDEWTLQGHYGQGWEDLCTSDSRREIRADLRSYEENEGGRYRIICRRILKSLPEGAAHAKP